jgi:hypothetical protein
VVDGGAGTGSAFEVAGNATAATKAPVTVAVASVAHNALGRVEFGST